MTNFCALEILVADRRQDLLRTAQSTRFAVRRGDTRTARRRMALKQLFIGSSRPAPAPAA